MREIKFRIWDIRLKTYLPFTEDLKLLKFQIEEYVIQQFTGLKDKKGKEIYEGDIVKTTFVNYKLQTIIFEYGAFRLSEISQYDHNYDDIQNSEIVGNIFENSELLKNNLKNWESKVIKEIQEENNEVNLDTCEQCGHPAWDGYICHICGIKHI